MKTANKRMTILRKTLFDNKKKGFDTLMVQIAENRRYLSGFTGEDTGYNESAGTLFITETKSILATDSRFEQQAKNEASSFEIICYKKGLIKELPHIIERLGTTVLGIESHRISYHQYEKISEIIKTQNINIELVEADNSVENLRIKKAPEEIKQIKKGLYIAESVFKNLTMDFLIGRTEKEVAWAIEKKIRESGAEAISFPPITASGKNSALPHAIPGNKIIEEGKPILFDWGAKLNGYCSDISRTLFLGTPDDKFKKIFTTVNDSQKMAIDAIKPGINSIQIDMIARDHIEKKGFKNRFGHGLGHGVGLAIHEAPGISPLKETILEPGMVFTIEPGIYIPGWGGIRLENMVVVKEDGAEVLNTLENKMNPF